MPDGQTGPRTLPRPLHARRDIRSGIDANNPSVDRLAQSQAVLMSGTVDVVETAQAFLQSRLYANLNACKSLISCRYPMELAELHWLYVENTRAQYNKYAQNMSERVRQCVRDMRTKSDDADIQ